MKNLKFIVLSVVVMVIAASLLVISCGSPSTTVNKTPIKISYNDGFTGFMAMDAAMTEHGILTALAQWDNQVLGRPIEYSKVDNQSDVVAAVDKARQTVENDKVDVIFGPVFSPATAAITDYLAKSSGIPDISIFGQPHNNLVTANKLAFIPAGMHSFQGYILGKYAAEELHYKTATVINYEEDTGRDIAEGFAKGFGEGGGQVLQTQFVPEDVIDFSSYLTTLQKADCTCFWIFGNGAGPFVKQYYDYGIKQPLIMELADDIQEPTLAELGDISLDIIATDHYIPLIDNELNKKFVADYTKQWNGEQPNMDSFGGWMAVNLFLKAVEKTNGDTSPKAIIEAMSNMSLDTPAGKYTMSPYGDAYIGTGDFYICKSVRLDNGRYTWQPLFTYDQIRFEDKR
jgi:branched-chain amino acid transport system substrate-binding protein